jgi:type IV secretory pathway VirB3-like protein
MSVCMSVCVCVSVCVCLCVCVLIHAGNAHVEKTDSRFLPQLLSTLDFCVYTTQINRVFKF